MNPFQASLSRAGCRAILGALVWIVIAVSFAPAQSIITVLLDPQHTGNYWYQKSQWMGGSSTDDGFSYGAPTTGIIKAQALYYYYGGADRDFEYADIYFQIPLALLTDREITSATLNFFVESQNTTAETFLKHLETQSVSPTGFAEQKLAGTQNIISSSLFTLGWNQIDVTAAVVADQGQGYDFAVFSIPRFAQVMDQNRLLNIYGASAPSVGGLSVRPYLQVSAGAVPEPASASLLLGGIALCWGLRRRRRVARR